MKTNTFKQTIITADTRIELTYYLFSDLVISHNVEYFTGLSPEVLASEQIHIEPIHGLKYPDLNGVFGWGDRQTAFEQLSLDCEPLNVEIPKKIKTVWESFHTPNYGGNVFQLDYKQTRQLKQFELLLDRNKPTILIITGATGSGKTTLALQLLDWFGYKPLNRYNTSDSEHIIKATIPHKLGYELYILDGLQKLTSKELHRLVYNDYKIIITTELDLQKDEILDMLPNNYYKSIFYIRAMFKKQMRLPNL